MNLPRMFGNAIVRRIAYIVAGLLVYGVLSAFGVGVARADATTREQAVTSCKGDLNWRKNANPSYNYGCASNNDATDTAGDVRSCKLRSGYTHGAYYESPTAVSTYCSQTYSIFSFDTLCPVGLNWNSSTGKCDDPAVCLAKNIDAKKSNAIAGTGTLCIDGCAYGMNSGQTITIGGTSQVLQQGSMGFTGASCNVPPPDPPYDPNEDNQACTQVPGSMTVCIKPNGEHCYSTPYNGRYICWRPGETGEKNDGNTRQVRAPGTNPPAPTPPTNGDTLTQTGTTTTTTTVNTTGPTIVTNTTNYNTDSGTDAGPSDDGEPGDGTGGDDGSGGAGPGLGDSFYEGSGDTLSSVWADFKGQVEAAPIVAAGTAFLTFSGSASCPTWTVPATDFWPEMTATWLCQGELAEALTLGGWVVLALAAWAAFKIAVY